MGKLEQVSRQRTRRRNIQKIILGAVATAGVLSIALVVPNVLGALGKLGFLPHPREGETVRRARKRLIEKGFVTYKGKFLHLTELGRRELRKFELADYPLKKPKRWDQKWRLLIFDIPEPRKSLREKLRRTLSTIGFVRLQDSVWLYPYDCEDLATLLKADFHVGKDILYLIVDTLENDALYRKRFGLR